MTHSKKKSQYILSIDTSSKQLCLAVSNGEKVLASKSIVLGKDLSRLIIPTIDNVLKKAKVSIAMLDALAVGLGPGSFTSLRVGLATIKGLAEVLEIPVVGIPSLAILANGIPEDDPHNLVLVDAKRNMFYAGLFERRRGELKVPKKYQLASLEEICKDFKGPLTLTGDGIILVKDELKQMKNIQPNFVPEKYWYPNAKHLSRLAFEQFQQKKFKHVSKIVPLYLYPEDCQVTRKS